MRTALAIARDYTSPYLGPARVREVSGNLVRLDVTGAETRAQVALAFPYELHEGDVVLAISQDSSWYVIGVLEHTGRTRMTLPGDFELCAPHGRIDVKAGNEIHLKGPSVKIVATNLEILSRAILERCGRATRWVKESFQLRAGRARTVVESDYRLHAGRIVERAKGPVKIDGRKIDLG
jgi:Protein of unknown function (DUF3540)